MRKGVLYIVLVILVLALVGNIIWYVSGAYLGLQPVINSVVQPGTSCYPSEPELELTCVDGNDNDCDGNIDCSDSDCSGIGFCVVPELEGINPGNVHPGVFTPVYLSGSDFNLNSRVSFGGVVIPKLGTHFISSQMLIVEALPGAFPGDYYVYVSNNLNDPDMKSGEMVLEFVNPNDYIIDSCDICSTLGGVGCNRNSCEGAVSSTCLFGTSDFETLEGSCSLCESIGNSCSGYEDDALSCIRNTCGIPGGCSFRNGKCEGANSLVLGTQGTCSGEPMPSCIPYGVCEGTRPSCVGGNWNCDFEQNQDLEVFVEVSCSDGLDNDCDNKVDCNDYDCSNNVYCNSSPNPGNVGGGELDPACSNGIDDDDDGLIDLADPGCLNANDNSEGDIVPGNSTYIPTIAACADGLDNDNDGKIDLADPGCLNANDNSELDVLSTGGIGGQQTQTLNSDEDSNLNDVIFWVITGFLALGIIIILFLIIMRKRIDNKSNILVSPMKKNFGEFNAERIIKQ